MGRQGFGEPPAPIPGGGAGLRIQALREPGERREVTGARHDLPAFQSDLGIARVPQRDGHRRLRDIGERQPRSRDGETRRRAQSRVIDRVWLRFRAGLGHRFLFSLE